MSSESETPTGLLECFSNFTGAYCTRKLSELVVSGVLLLATLGMLCAYGWKYRLQRRQWLTAILGWMGASLLANILFCFLNQSYWLYAVENYAYNMYFLLIVGYVARAYLFKPRPIGHKEARDRSGVAFYAVFLALVVLETGIFAASVVMEVNSQRNHDSGRVRYCEEPEYLAFDVLCSIMSIVVLVILHKNQLEEQLRMEQFSTATRARPRGSLLSEENEGSSPEDQDHRRMHSPLKSLWVWIVTNVACQIFGLVQSGLLLDATPSACLIVPSNPTASNYIDLAFTVLTMYMGFAVTIWYTILVGFVRERAGIDRTVTFSQEVKMEGNIELFNPSKEETIFSL